MMQQEDSVAAVPINVFYSYASEDETDQATLEKYLSSLRQRGLITDWHRRKIAPGRDQEQEIKDQLITAQIILLLLSADYLASNYHSNIEMPRALQRHANGEARVIPILLRPCDWENSPLGNLSPLPTTYKPISQSQDRDAAFLDVARGIRTVVDELIGRSLSIPIRSKQEQELSTSSKRPRNYIPFPRNPLFQPRPGEFERLDQMLISSGMQQRSLRIGLIGMIGMGGVGKTQLAVELAYRCQRYFPSGVFWVTATGITTFEWQHHLAELAGITEYLPHNDDVSSPENEARRARHFCRYLACHADALVILDNVEDPTLVMSTLPSLAGGEVACTILYTSRKRFAPPGVTIHAVEKLPEEGALRLLLETTRPSLLTEVLAGSQHAEAKAARAICHGVGYLPLAIVHLQGSLARDPRLTLVRLAEVLKERGALEVAKKHYLDAAPLFATFRLSWEQMHDEGAQRLFELASYFQEATPVPLWLLGLAAGLGESGDIFEPLGEAGVQLQELSLLEELSEGQVRLHPLVREFGRRMVAEDGDKGKMLLQEARERMTTEFVDLNRLERRARREGYWNCLEQVRAAREYAELLLTEKAERLAQVERWLDRESCVLADGRWWPQALPGLFYQQLANRALEEGAPLSAGEAPARWLRQRGQVGAEDRSLLRIFASYTGAVYSVAFTPDGSRVLTGSYDKTARLWEMASGKLLATLAGHTDSVYSVAFAPDGSRVLTGSGDNTARVWETASGRLLATLAGHTNLVRSVAFTPDGSRVLTGSNDGTARLWETASGKQLATLVGHTGWVVSVAFSPDGCLAMTYDGHGWMFLWQASGADMRSLLGMYVATNEVGAVHWQDNTHVVLADKGGPHFQPHFYRLKLEGM